MRRAFSSLAVVALCLGLGACVMPGSDAAYLLSREYPRENLSPQNFIVCLQHGCNKEVEVSLTDEQWQEIRDIFAAPPVVGEPGTPEGERAQIAFALARMEQLVAPLANTGGDVGGSFSGFGRTNQLDCVDEMVNTTTYLTIMYNDGLFRFHRPGHRVTEALSIRGFWPHTVMTIYDITDGDKAYVIDTWIKNNGEVPYVMALSDWRAGVHHHDLVTGEELTRMIY